MSAGSTAPPHSNCPSCGRTGKRVSVATLKGLLKNRFAAELSGGAKSNGERGCSAPQADSGWRFCNSQDCEVVYFSESGDRTFLKSHLLVAVGVKEKLGQRPLCYCFGHSVASIKEELRAKGHSDALVDIRAKMKDPGCRCEIENPAGACCLGSVTKGIQTARRELGMTTAHTETESEVATTADGTINAASARSSTVRGETIAKIGTVVSAIIASACCWLPMLLLAVGASGAGIAATLEAYRPLFIVVTFGFLAAAFYFTYRPKMLGVKGGHGCCPTEDAVAGDCCAPTSKPRFNMLALNKVMLWSVTVVAVAFLFFPSYVGVLFSTTTDSVVTENMNRAVFHIEGMTCEGCSTTVSQAIHRVPGVVAVEVSYEQERAVVGVNPGEPIPEKEVLAALEKAGYDGELLTTKEKSADFTSTVTTPALHLNDSLPAGGASESLIDTVLDIEGMTCEGCAADVSEAIHNVPGVTGVRVDFQSRQVTVQSPACCDFPREAVLSAVEKAGFDAKVSEEQTYDSDPTPEN